MFQPMLDTVCERFEPISTTTSPTKAEATQPIANAACGYAFEIGCCSSSAGVLTAILQCFACVQATIERLEFDRSSTPCSTGRLYLQFLSDERGADLLRRKLMRLIEVASVELSAV